MAIIDQQHCQPLLNFAALFGRAAMREARTRKKLDTSAAISQQPTTDFPAKRRRRPYVARSPLSLARHRCRCHWHWHWPWRWHSGRQHVCRCRQAPITWLLLPLPFFSLCHILIDTGRWSCRRRTAIPAAAGPAATCWPQPACRPTQGLPRDNQSIGARC